MAGHDRVFHLFDFSGDFVTASAQQRGKPWRLLRPAAVLAEDFGGDAIGEDLPARTSAARRCAAVHVLGDVERELEQIAVAERIAQFTVAKRRS